MPVKKNCHELQQRHAAGFAAYVNTPLAWLNCMPLHRHGVAAPPLVWPHLPWRGNTSLGSFNCISLDEQEMETTALL